MKLKSKRIFLLEVLVSLAIFSVVLGSVLRTYSGQLKKIYSYQNEQDATFAVHRVLTKAVEQLYFSPDIYRQQLLYGGVIYIDDPLFQSSAFNSAFVKVDHISSKGAVHLISISIANVTGINTSGLPTLKLSFEVSHD